MTKKEMLELFKHFWPKYIPDPFIAFLNTMIEAEGKGVSPTTMKEWEIGKLCKEHVSAGSAIADW